MVGVHVECNVTKYDSCCQWCCGLLFDHCALFTATSVTKGNEKRLISNAY